MDARFTAASTSNGDDGAVEAPQGNNRINTIYLFTFLATLLLLGLISGSIITRAIILRRRWRRQREQSDVPPLTFGDVLLPARVVESRRIHQPTLKRPIMHDIWVLASGMLDPCSEWVHLKPLSFRACKTKKYQSSHSIVSCTPEPGKRRVHALRYFGGCELESSSIPPPSQPQGLVTVLVAMPSVRNARSTEGFPNVALGMRREPYITDEHYTKEILQRLMA
ncbi:hypothetical protein CYLTODRAFT_418777 [Cylindrobasidium torrendii FP15055 ss-10]|uniref:Uncharacterized protein n=1 Tax=Cylindrobasidium torrendii FP15055 ss-10 TaxID=1314674 RepID=A0A0D7BN04_9AGAR|nr:hypothetical protein CYLTODRAFT_418777 [Cylindrobasidium torrendii FP15055 ss-10]